MIETIEFGISGHLIVSGDIARMGAKKCLRGNDRGMTPPRLGAVFARQIPRCRRFVAEHQP